VVWAAWVAGTIPEMGRFGDTPSIFVVRKGLILKRMWGRVILISNRCRYSIDMKVDAGAKKYGKSGKTGKTSRDMKSARAIWDAPFEGSE